MGCINGFRPDSYQLIRFICLTLPTAGQAEITPPSRESLGGTIPLNSPLYPSPVLVPHPQAPSLRVWPSLFFFSSSLFWGPLQTVCWVSYFHLHCQSPPAFSAELHVSYIHSDWMIKYQLSSRNHFKLHKSIFCPTWPKTVTAASVPPPKWSRGFTLDVSRGSSFTLMLSIKTNLIKINKVGKDGHVQTCCAGFQYKKLKFVFKVD